MQMELLGLHFINVEEKRGCKSKCILEIHFEITNLHDYLSKIKYEMEVQNN